MTQKQMVMAFSRMGIPSRMFWLGAAEKAEGVNGMTYDGNRWIVYYRDCGQMLNVKECDTHSQACDELFFRVMASRRTALAG